MSSQPPDQYGTPRRLHRVLAILVMLCIGAALVAHLVHEKKPPTNSAAYRAAHGIAEGRTNELRVRGVLLRFPSDYLPNPYSDGDIVPGQADRVTVDLDLGGWFDPPPTAHSYFLALVEVGIEKYRVEDVAINRGRLAGPWKSVAGRADLGLREYVRPDDGGGWGYRMYVPLDPALTTPKGGPIIYTCAGRPGGDPERCRTQYQHRQGPYVQYYLSALLLPRWREVHAEVLRKVDSFIVHKGDE